MLDAKIARAKELIETREQIDAELEQKFAHLSVAQSVAKKGTSRAPR